MYFVPNALHLVAPEGGTVRLNVVSLAVRCTTCLMHMYIYVNKLINIFFFVHLLMCLYVEMLLTVGACKRDIK